MQKTKFVENGTFKENNTNTFLIIRPFTLSKVCGIFNWGRGKFKATMVMV